MPKLAKSLTDTQVRTAKHGVYSKANIKRANARFHIDVFALTDAVYLDDDLVYRDGAWQV